MAIENWRTNLDWPEDIGYEPIEYLYEKDGETKSSFSDENALAVLLLDETVFLNSHWWRKDLPEKVRKLTSLNVSCNDVFVWGSADAEEMAEDHPDLAASIAAQDPVPLSIFGGSSTENLLKELHDMNEANRLKYGDFDAVQETDHSVDQKEAEEEAELIVEPTPHEQFISLLERHPEFLTEVIHAVDETRAEAESQQGWLDPNNVKDRA